MQTLTQTQKDALIVALEAKLDTVHTEATEADIAEIAKILCDEYRYTLDNDIESYTDITLFESYDAADEYLSEQYSEFDSYETDDADATGAVVAKLFTLSTGKAFYFHCA